MIAGKQLGVATQAEGTTISGACLYRAYNCSSAISLNVKISCSGWPFGYICNGNQTSLGLSGTWRAMTKTKSPYCTTYIMGLYLRVS